MIPPSELIINPDNSIYHIKLREEHVADNVIVVGDQGRVELISSFFDKIEVKIQSREFVTHVGEYKGKKITVMSTGIGTDNIDIAISELDAAVNIDLEKRQVKETKRKLNIIRIGTSGALQEDIPVDGYLLSEYGLGLDGLMHHYEFEHSDHEKKLLVAFNQQVTWNSNLPAPYIVEASESLFNRLKTDEMHTGITATASGFYGPQGRELRLKPINSWLNEELTAFSFNKNRITNFEMETSALFGLGKLLGHDCVTVCAIIANRIRKEYSKDYKKTIKELVEIVLDRL
ncbi:MAG: nucleoside phosphorylase [Flavobacteriales bacterium]|nr:nucleoside phosphorylase [Flavobacteriales bacterium]